MRFQAPERANDIRHLICFESYGSLISIYIREDVCDFSPEYSQASSFLSWLGSFHQWSRQSKIRAIRTANPMPPARALNMCVLLKRVKRVQRPTVGGPSTEQLSSNPGSRPPKPATRALRTTFDGILYPAQ